MDNPDANASNRSALRQPFIDTANALAYFYKQAGVAERDARDAGSRAAFQKIIQWAALKSRSAEPVSAADVISFCAAELAQLPTHSVSTERAPHSSHVSNAPTCPPASRVDADMPHGEAPTVSYVPRDDALVSDIKKLHVNPRKRQRVDISDAFIRACRNQEDSFVFTAPDQSHGLQNHDGNSNALGHSGLQGMQHNALHSKKDIKDSREFHIHHTSGNEYISRKPRHPKSHIYDKHKRK
ncbi:unnamed protein product [Agarophyton chilense]|eukprot:gb/GEZJ01002111.1/.p1 GENE.gb/GEZJ01002111.1/~~gb/GEZJ01002111.1/.p1  ORF type:complete len:240 (-),score=26.61 gb/GEZJ01002111.1/:621-1340(-)